MLLWLLEKQANHRCTWGSISAHPFWQPNPPAAPGTLPAQPLFDSIVTTLERSISKQLEDQAIHDAEKSFQQKSDFKDDSYVNPNLAEENSHGNLSESKYHSSSAPNLIGTTHPPPSYIVHAGTAIHHVQPNPTPMKVLPRSESTPIRPVAKPPPIPIAIPLYSQNHPNADNKAQEKGSTLPSSTPSSEQSKYAKDTQHAHATPVATKQDSILKEKMNLHHHASPSAIVAMNAVNMHSNITTPLKSKGNPLTGLGFYTSHIYIHTCIHAFYPCLTTKVFLRHQY